LIVVLNDVSAAARERLERRSPPVLTVAGGPDIGFAGGVAAGLAVARGEWIALVNDDCALHPDALRELLAAGERDPGVGSVAAQIRFAARPDTINSAGIEIDELGVAWERRLGEPASACETDPVEVFGASAALALHRRAMLDALGGLDASFFAYLEDADLAWRARMAGWRCVLAPRAGAGPARRPPAKPRLPLRMTPAHEPFQPLSHPLVFEQPRRLTDVDSWHEHIPFAFFAVAALRPRLLVELGTWKGDSYCAFCQA